MDSLHKISITCFAASYLVALILELSRLLTKAEPKASTWRRMLKIGFVTAGLFAHSVYLVMHGGVSLNVQGIWLGNWFTWCLATSWLLGAAYLWMAIRKHESGVGLFLLPLMLVLIGIGLQFGNANQFTASNARTAWNMIHGASLLLGTAIVTLGCTFGMVYLIQAKRLKQKTISSGAFRLPSLEWLQQSSERSLLISTILMGMGLISGIAINQVPGDGQMGVGVIAWSNPVIWTSGVLFLWLLMATLVNQFYRPARQGRKVAYLVMASFLFLVLELAIVWWVGHAT